MAVFDFFKLKRNKDGVKRKNALTERGQGDNLPAKSEKQVISDVQRRLNALEKKKNPKYNAEYVPYFDPAEERSERVRNSAYLKIAGRYRTLKWITFFLLAVYCSFMVFTFKDEITVENFRYMIRSVDFDSDTGFQMKNDIVYASNDENSFAKYREYLALVNGDGLTVYDTFGSVAHSEELTYTEPCLAVSDKYLLVYDRQGGDYSLYTYFAKENSAALDYPVSCAAVSDAGVYALASKGKDHAGEVYIYNSSFKLMNRVMKNKHISSIALTDSGDEILICSYFVDENGQSVSEITVLPTSSDQSRLLFTLRDTAVYGCSYFEDGSFVLLCRDGLKFYSREGKHTLDLTYNDTSAVRHTVTDTGVLLVLENKNDPSKCTVVRTDSTGKSVSRYEFDTGILDLAFDKDTLYLLYSDRAVRVKGEEKPVQVPIDKGRRAIAFASGSGAPYVCTRTVAYIPEWED